MTSQVCIGVISPGSCHLQHEEHVGAGGVVYRQEPREHLRLGVTCSSANVVLLYGLLFEKSYEMQMHLCCSPPLVN